MKTPKEICKDIFAYINGTELKDAITGVVSYNGRKTDREDCCIQLQDNMTAQVQECFVYVRIYVKDIVSDGKDVEDISRTEVLERLCSEVLESGFGDDFRFDLDQQLTLKVADRDEHCITNRVEYKHFNG